MSLATNITNLATRAATEDKALRTLINGNAADLTGLTTTAKTNLVAAINEVKAGATGSPPTASETQAGVVELASLTEVATGTDTARAVTAAGVRQERAALKAEILGGAGPAFDTLNELKALVDAAEESADITSLTTLVGTKANAADVYTKTEIGNPETDFVAVYQAGLV